MIIFLDQTFDFAHSFDFFIGAFFVYLQKSINNRKIEKIRKVKQKEPGVAVNVVSF